MFFESEDSIEYYDDCWDYCQSQDFFEEGETWIFDLEECLLEGIMMFWFVYSYIC